MKRGLGFIVAAVVVGIPMGIIGAITITASSSEEDLGAKYTHAVQCAASHSRARQAQVIFLRG